MLIAVVLTTHGKISLKKEHLEQQTSAVLLIAQTEFDMQVSKMFLIHLLTNLLLEQRKIISYQVHAQHATIVEK